MSVSRWDPFREMMSLREAMDRLFEESVVRSPAPTSASTALPLDISESESEFTVQATLPGVKPEDIDINILGDTLRISGQSKAESERQGERWLLRERRAGRFERQLTLPAPVKADAVTAAFEHGVLTLTLPKSDAARPRQIKIQGAETAKPIDVQAGTTAQ